MSAFVFFSQLFFIYFIKLQRARTKKSRFFNWKAYEGAYIELCERARVYTYEEKNLNTRKKRESTRFRHTKSLLNNERKKESYHTTRDKDAVQRAAREKKSEMYKIIGFVQLLFQSEPNKYVVFVVRFDVFVFFCACIFCEHTCLLTASFAIFPQFVLSCKMAKSKHKT